MVIGSNTVTTILLQQVCQSQKVYNFSSGGNAITENYAYQNGTLTEIKQNGQNSIWKLLSEDAFGHPTAVSTGPLNRTYSYDDYGFPTTRKAVTSSGAVIQISERCLIPLQET